MIHSILLFCLFNISFPFDSLSISTEKRIINASKDSILFIDIIFKNVNNRKFVIRKLDTVYYGRICFSQEWLIHICHKGYQYSLPMMFCNYRKYPYLVLRKNEEYNFRLPINFKTIDKENDYNKPNYDFGEYEIHFSLKMKGRDIINSNKIKVFYDGA